MSMQGLKKTGQSPETTFLRQSSAITVVYKQYCNPKPLLSDIDVHAKFQENWSKTTRVRKQSADGWTLKIFGGYNNTLPLFVWRGIIKALKCCQNLYQVVVCPISLGLYTVWNCEKVQHLSPCPGPGEHYIGPRVRCLMEKMTVMMSSFMIGFSANLWRPQWLSD